MSSSPGTGRELGKTDAPTSGVMIMGTVSGMVRGRSAYDVDGACKRVSFVCVTERNHTKHTWEEIWMVHSYGRGWAQWHCATKTA